MTWQETIASALRTDDGGMTVAITVWAIYLGILFGALFGYYHKKIIGSFIRALCACGAYSAAEAKTVEELGQERNRYALRALKRRGGDRVIFLGRVSRETLRRCYAEARALLFPGVEDFGIVPLEAQCAGTPVIACGAGGALETVVSGETGLFFEEQSVKSLQEAILEFERSCWSSPRCRENGLRFSPERFKTEFSAAVSTVF